MIGLLTLPQKIAGAGMALALALVVLGVWLGILKLEIAARDRTIDHLTTELGGVKVDLGVAKAANQANVAEFKRLTADYADFQHRSALTIDALAKRHDKAVSDRVRLLEEVKNVPPDSDPILSDRARRILDELRAVHPQAR